MEEQSAEALNHGHPGQLVRVRWSRSVAVPVTGGAIILLGIPSALSASSELFGAGMAKSVLGHSWFDLFDYVSSNWMLPLCGLGISVFAAWKLGEDARRAQFAAGSSLGKLEWLYLSWLQVLRGAVPAAILVIMLHALGVF